MTQLNIYSYYVFLYIYLFITGKKFMGVFEFLRFFFFFKEGN